MGTYARVHGAAEIRFLGTHLRVALNLPDCLLSLKYWPKILHTCGNLDLAVSMNPLFPQAVADVSKPQGRDQASSLSFH